MGRRNLRQKVVPSGSEVVTVQCQGCSKRLGVIWTSDMRVHDKPTTDGAWIGAEAQHGSIIAGTVGPNCHSGIKAIEHEDWVSVACNRCGHQWRGRDGYLFQLARQNPGQVVRLGQPLRNLPQEPPITSRSW